MNSAHGLTPENLLAALPQVLREDESMNALAASIADLLSVRQAEIDLSRIYAEIDRLPEEMLDILAYDFKVDWWDGDYTVEEKRQTLKDSWRVHRMLGTKGAVEAAISAIYPATKMQEWFEYGGEPYFFRLRINAKDLRTDDTRHTAVLNRVNYYKNLRSHLDGFEWDYTTEPFINDPDIFKLHRLILSLAFSNRRNFPPGVLFDGSEKFDGAAMFGQAPQAMFGFPLFKVGAAFPGVRENFEGADLKYGGIRFVTDSRLNMPALRILLPAFSNVRNIIPARFDGSTLFDGSTQFGRTASMFSMPAFQVQGSIGTNESRIGKATLTIDSMYHFDGGASFDGARKFNADIIKEDL